MSVLSTLLNINVNKVNCWVDKGLMQSKWKKAPNRNLSFMTSCNLFLLHNMYWQVSNLTPVFTINCNYYNSQRHLTQRLGPGSPHIKDFTSQGIHLQTPAWISHCKSNCLHSTLDTHSKFCDLHCLKKKQHIALVKHEAFMTKYLQIFKD